MSARIETERLVLRLPRLEDAGVAAEYLNDPEVTRYLGGATLPPESASAVLTKWLERWNASGVGGFAIERRADGRVLGQTGILVWDRRDWTQSTYADAKDDAQPELGWVLAREHWGHGYATEAAMAVQGWMRHERGAERLISLIHPDNARSQRVAERLGARPGETVTLFDSGPAVVWVHPE